MIRRWVLVVTEQAQPHLFAISDSPTGYGLVNVRQLFQPGLKLRDSPRIEFCEHQPDFPDIYTYFHDWL